MADNSLDINVRVRDFATRELGKIKDAVGSMGDGFNRVANLATPLWRIMFTISMLAAPFLALAAALYKVADAGISFNKSIENARLGIAALIGANAQITDASGKELQGRERINASLAKSQEIVKQLQIAGLQTAATTTQLVDAFQQAVAPAMRVGLSFDQIAKVVVRIVQAAGALGLPMEQLNEEVRSIMEGSINMHSRVAKALGLTNELVQRWKSQGPQVFFKELMDRMQDFGEMGEETAKSWNGVLSNMREAWEMFTGEITKDVFTGLKEKFNEIFQGLVDTSTLSVSPAFQGIADAFTLLFSDIGGGLTAGLDKVVEWAKDLSKWLSDNKEKIGAIWIVLKAVVREFGGIILSILRMIGETLNWGVQTNWVLSLLKVVHLMLAGIRDFALLLELGFRTIGSVIQEWILEPLSSVVQTGGRLAEKLGLGSLADALKATGTWLTANVDENRARMVQIAEMFASGKSNVQQALTLHQNLDKVVKSTLETLKEKKKVEETTEQASIAPKLIDLNEEQRKKVEDFTTWAKEKFFQLSGQISDIHGDEVGKYKNAYQKTIEEIAKKTRELKDAGAIDSDRWTPEARAKIQAAWGAIKNMQDEALRLLNAQIELYAVQQAKKIADMTLAPEEERHRRRLEMIKIQYKENEELMKAAIVEENRLFTLAIEERENTRRDVMAETQRLFMEGPQKQVQELKMAYDKDLDNYRQQAIQKKITWAQYDAYVQAREYRLQEELKKVQGTAYEGFKNAVRDYVDAASIDYERGKEFFNNTMSTMEGSMGQFLNGVVRGTDTIGKLFTKLADSILTTWINMVAKMVVQWMASGLASLLGIGLSPVAGAQGSFGPAAPSSTPVTAYAAAGGVFQGGWAPIKAFAKGGIVNRPTVGVVGEGGQNEAVVPLPDGRAIPVNMRGQVQPVIVKQEWTIIAQDTASMDQAIMARRQMIEGIVHDALARGGVLRNAVKRYGR